MLNRIVWTDFEQVILFECSSKSGQSHITPEFAQRAAESIVKESAGRHAVILCSQHAVQRPLEGIIDGSILTLREMAELTKYCTLLIGCSSGISCISTSTWAKPLPMIQMLSSRCAMFASLAHDYLYFGLPTSHVIEMFDADVERLVSCFDFFVKHGWERREPPITRSPRSPLHTTWVLSKPSCLASMIISGSACLSGTSWIDTAGTRSLKELSARSHKRFWGDQWQIERCRQIIC